MEEQKTTYGLIGYPLSHSLSPLMHNAAFKELEVEAIYTLYPLMENELEGFFKALKENSSEIFGLNVTVPYKEKVIPFIDQLTPFAAKIKAVNTIVIDKKRNLVGYNTDGPGFLAHLTELGVETKGKAISIMGAGGASRAIMSVLCILDERPASIRIYDIEKGKAEILISDLSERINMDIVECVHCVDDLEIQNADLLINATPLGMKAEDPLIVDPDSLHEELFVYDIVYNPSETKLLQMAKEKGSKNSNGLGMLFYQGVLAFQHWANVLLDEKVKNVMLEALEEGLYKKG